MRFNLGSISFESSYKSIFSHRGKHTFTNFLPFLAQKRHSQNCFFVKFCTFQALFHQVKRLFLEKWNKKPSENGENVPIFS